jgi:hypothetical protein
MSYNSWLYVDGNPINGVDPNGRMPLECSHIDQIYWNSITQCADLAHRSESPESYLPYVAPSELAWNPVVNVNLASVEDMPQNSPHAEENKMVTGMGHGLCGQIALAMIMETITGKTDLLKEIWQNTDPKYISEKTTASDLEPAVFAILKHQAQESNWRVTTYSYQQILTYTSQGSYYEQNNQGQWYGDEQGSLIAPRFREMLRRGHYVMVLCTMKQDTNLMTNPWGTLTNNNNSDNNNPNPTAGHWVVLTGMSSQWDSSNEDSKWNWVRINNTYSNQEQYYPWKFFKDSMFKYNGPNTNASPSVMEIWHK